MERWQKASLAAVVCLALVLASFLSGYAYRAAADRRTLTGPIGHEEGLRVIEDAYEQILSSADQPPPGDALARGAVEGMVRVLRQSDDPYALLYSRSERRSLRELTQGEFSGIGIWLIEKDGRLKVSSVVPETPAEEAGIRRGDIVAAIDGTPATELTPDEVVDRIKGRVGTKITLLVERGRSRKVTFTMTRRTIEVPNLQARVIGGDIGYVRLFGFARGAGQQVREEVTRFRHAGIEGVILDLRDNGGGLLSEAVRVASVFLEDGPIVTLRQEEEAPQEFTAGGDAFEDLRVVVLVNGGTASASEVVAGALQDRERGVLVGTKTFGKGSVQEVLTLLDASALKLTTGTYLTPDGADIESGGIAPDIQVADPRRQRSRAVEVLRGMLLSARS